MRHACRSTGVSARRSTPRVARRDHPEGAVRSRTDHEDRVHGRETTFTPQAGEVGPATLTYVANDGAVSVRPDVPPETPSLDENVVAFVERQKWIDAGRREARTDADGTYRLDVARTRYAMTAHAEGHEVRARGKSWGIEPEAVLDFEATVLLAVDADVLLPDGGMVEEATIRWNDGRHVGHARSHFDSATGALPRQDHRAGWNLHEAGRDAGR